MPDRPWTYVQLTGAHFMIQKKYNQETERYKRISPQRAERAARDLRNWNNMIRRMMLELWNLMDEETE